MKYFEAKGLPKLNHSVFRKLKSFVILPSESACHSYGEKRHIRYITIETTRYPVIVQTHTPLSNGVIKLKTPGFYKQTKSNSEKKIKIKNQKDN